MVTLETHESNALSTHYDLHEMAEVLGVVVEVYLVLSRECSEVPILTQALPRRPRRSQRPEVQVLYAGILNLLGQPSFREAGLAADRHLPDIHQHLDILVRKPLYERGYGATLVPDRVHTQTCALRQPLSLRLALQGGIVHYARARRLPVTGVGERRGARR